ncbi:S-adenosyl-L-methionine-dependent methyltransferase [Syncephalis fuscata]|nr:S-adenosyl-L-methionine-dependent methyltransferase [Syncephalis fuscata]
MHYSESNKHYLMNTIFGRNYFVPFDNVKRALDINTGTGVWALEMATDFPNTLFLGVDSEACYPQSTMPPNCRFESMNILEGLNCASELFDYVHIRFQLAFIPTNKWQTLLLEVYRVTCPGGWIEIVEWDAFYRQGGPISNRMTDQLDGKLTDAGFMQVTTRAYDVPLGLWGGKIGQQMLLDVKSIASVIAPGAIQAGLFGPNEVPSLVEEWEKEIEITKPYVRYYVYTGQRPG